MYTNREDYIAAILADVREMATDRVPGARGKKLERPLSEIKAMI